MYVYTQKLERAQQLLKKSRMKDYYAVNATSLNRASIEPQ